LKQAKANQGKQAGDHRSIALDRIARQGRMAARDAFGSRLVATRKARAS
jgi:hypothetical protein